VSWVTIIGSVSTASVMGAIALGWAVNLFSTLRGDTNEDRVWLAFFATVLGFFLGMAVGILTPLVSGGGYLRNLGVLCALLFVFVLTVKLVARIHAPPPATIQGENLVLEAEIQMPPDWSPQSAAAPAESNCRLAPNTDRENGIVEWDRMERPSDSGWVIPCSFVLRPSYPRAGSIYAPGPWVRSLFVSLGSDRSPGALALAHDRFLITLPRDSFSEKQELWSEWREDTQDQKSMNPLFPFRFRVQRESAVKAAKLARAKERSRKKWRDSATLGADTPVELFLDAFEPDPDLPAAEVPEKDAAAIQRRVNERTLGFAATLRSPDRALVRRTVYALAQVPRIPGELTQALLEAGHQVASYVNSGQTPKGDTSHELDNDANLYPAARAALEFLDQWDRALDDAAGPVEQARYQAILDEIQKAAGPRHSVFRTDLPSRVAIKLQDMMDKKR
jgi:hypothetical protein